MATATTETAITTATTETTKAAVTKKTKSVFTKVDQLKPGTGGHTLTVKVVSSKTVLQSGRLVSQHLRHTRILECLAQVARVWIGIVEVLVDMIKPGATVILHKAKIDMFKGSMRLAVDKWGRVEVTKDANFVVKEQNNLSLVEYELVNVLEECSFYVCYTSLAKYVFGVAVGMKNWPRVTFAIDPPSLEDGLGMIKAFYQRHMLRRNKDFILDQFNAC
ncbi:hypothetical protein AAG906_016389 [Vitis piasezkii]